MYRRAYLSLFGAIGSAGCTSSRGTESTETTDARRTTATETHTSEDVATTANPSTPTDRPTETETERASETPDAVDRTLDRAAADLNEAVEGYADAAGPNRGFHELNATSGFSFEDNAKPLYSARSRFNDVQGETDESQRERLSHLREVYWFLWWTGKTLTSLDHAFYRVNTTTSTFYDGEYARVESHANQTTEEIQRAEEMFASLKEDCSPEGLDATDGFSADDYSKTVTQFETEITQLTRFTEIIVRLADHAVDLRRGFDQYLHEEYADASGTFYAVSDEFDTLHETITAIDAVDAVESPFDEFRCLCDAFSNGSAVLDEAATAGSNGIPEKQETAEDNAKEEFESCDLVMQRITMVSEFFDGLPADRT